MQKKNLIWDEDDLRSAFWKENPQFDERDTIPAYDGNGTIYRTDVRVAWCQFVDDMASDGTITEALARTVTLRE